MNYNDFIAPPESSGSASLNSIEEVAPVTDNNPVNAAASPPRADATNSVVSDQLETPAEPDNSDQINPNLAHPNYSFDENPADTTSQTPIAQPPVTPVP